MGRLSKMAVLVAAIATVAACGGPRAVASSTLAPGLSAHDLIAAGPSADLHVYTSPDSEDLVAVSWREGHASYHVTSQDGGTTFSPRTAGLAASDTGPIERPGSHTTPASAGPNAWHTRTASSGRDWAFNLPALDPVIPPQAADEPCGGLVAVVAAEQGAGDVALTVHRYKPPYTMSTRTFGFEVGASIALARIASLSAPPAISALSGAAIVAWPEREGVQVVRVELPITSCAAPSTRRRS